MTSTAFSARRRLGPYEIVSLLGAGGMGEVYRARDPRLQRDVAIKVLPSEDGNDPDLLKRLAREARAVSQLNHPNIVAVYDVGSENGAEYVVMELLEGETLGMRLSGGPISPAKTLEWAAQISRGLAAAHEKNIIHRDLKPENIFLTRDGRVKILDFGLARHVPAQTDIRRLSSQLTAPGTVMGTAAYMSPEQARGLPVDHRSDLFSFGVVLYEMLSGRNPFEEQTAFETMTAIITREPADLQTLVPNLPPILYRIVAHCLEKSPDARFQSAYDLVFDLENCSGIWPSSTLPAAPPEPKKRFRVGALAAAVVPLLAAAAGAGVMYWATRDQRPSEQSYRRLTFRPTLIQSARFTAAGDTVVYSESHKGQPLRLHVLRADRPEAHTLAVPNADVAAISRSGEMAVLLQTDAFDWATGGTLAELPVLGGTPRELAKGVIFADWAPDGRMAVWRRTEEGVQRLEFPLGKVLYSGPNVAFGLRVSPKGDRIAVNLSADGRRSELVVFDLDGTRRTLVSDTLSAPGLAWTPDGKEVWYTTTPDPNVQGMPTVYGVTLDGKQRLVTQAPGGWTKLHDISRDGTVLVTVNATQGGLMVPAAGAEERDLGWLDGSVLADVSPDGKKVLFTEAAEGVQHKAAVYMRATDHSPAVRLGEGFALSFSPNRDEVLALRSSPKRREVVVLPTGAGNVEVLPNDLDSQWAGWLPDGRIVISARTAAGPRMFVQSRDGKPPRPLTPPGTAIGNINPAGGGAIKPISPDGSSLLVFDRAQRAWLVPLSAGANAQPRPARGVLPGERPAGWSRDGRHVYVYSILRIPVQIYDVDLVTGERRLLREFALPDLEGVFRIGPFLLMPDGQTFAYGVYRMFSTLYTVTGLR